MDKMREAFECEAARLGYDVTRNAVGDYPKDTNLLWTGWRAALQSKAVTSEDELMEVIAHAVYAHSPKAVNLAIAKKQAVAATKAILTQFNVTKKE